MVSYSGLNSTPGCNAHVISEYCQPINARAEWYLSNVVNAKTGLAKFFGRKAGVKRQVERVDLESRMSEGGASGRRTFGGGQTLIYVLTR